MNSKSKWFLAVFFTALAALHAQNPRNPQYRPGIGQQIEGPPTKAHWARWLEDHKNFRREILGRAGVDTEIYSRPELLWTQRSFIQTLAMVEDRYLYDPVARRYTVDRYLDDLERRYGGIDSIVIWPVYPNIGIDNRNQFDLLRDMPGGLPGLKKMVADFHRRGVRVLFPNMPWDIGTRPEALSFPETITKLLAEIGADGLHGDTYHGVPRTFRVASDRIGHPLALEPEAYPELDEMLSWDNMSWGYWKYPDVPMISRGKWLVSRHMVHVCDRWNKDKTKNLQAAFFNGVGYVAWENIWGIWNGITERDAEAIRRIAKFEQRFAEFLLSAEWEPHTPTLQAGIYASQWPLKGRTLWTLINKTGADTGGAQIATGLQQPGLHYFDLWHGVKIEPAGGNLSFPIEVDGFGAILAQPEPADPALEKFLAEMKTLNARPLASYPKEWKVLPQQIVPIAPARVAAPPEGMILIPATKAFDFEINGIEIENEIDPGTDVQYPWENEPRMKHRKTIEIEAFYIDRHPVMNRQFAAFLEASNYRPVDDHNFLRDWKNGKYPAGWDKKPVTWVSIEDARAYAKWAGKRLPHEWEWQYAAQGLDRRIYPWGNEWCDGCAPLQEHGRDLRPPTDVDAFPKGASPFGVEDLTGNVWQWTDEYVDEHTRAAILRGRGYYRPYGSRWYFPSAYKLTEHGKYLLIAPSKDRSGMIGFRCAADRG